MAGNNKIFTIYIYALIDPLTNDACYIGASVNPQSRLKAHMQGEQQKDNKRNQWIQSLKKQKLKPKLEIIEECSEENWPEREKFWITHYRAINPNLLNISKGGDGHRNLAMLNMWRTDPARHAAIQEIARTATYKCDVCGQMIRAFYGLINPHQANKKPCPGKGKRVRWDGKEDVKIINEDSI